MRRLLFGALLLCAAAPASGQVVQTVLPTVCNPNAPGDCTRATPTFALNGSGSATTPQRYQLLTNAAASGPLVTNVNGDGYIFDVRGTFNGATVTLTVSDAAGAQQATYSLTAPGLSPVNIAQGSSVQVTVTGGTPSGLNAVLGGVGGPIGNAVVTTATPAADGVPFAAPAGSTNGTLLAAKPAGTTVAICYYASGATMTYTWATGAPVAAPTLTWTVNGSSYPQWPETLGPNVNMYVTARTGTVICRYV